MRTLSARRLPRVRSAPRPFSLDPVLERLHALPYDPNGEPGPAATLAMILEGTFGMAASGARQRVVRWRNRGLSAAEADLLATEVLGRHPADVWDDWWTAGDET